MGFEGSGISIEVDARDALIRNAGGLPNRLQELAYRVFDSVDDAGRDHVLLADVQAAITTTR
jgi:hypothetical protein